MAHSFVGAVFDLLRRELASKYHGDVVLELETGPATPEQLNRIYEEIQSEFKTVTGFSAGGDANGYWKISVKVRPTGNVAALRQALSKWATRNEPFVRRHSLLRRSLWRRRRRTI